MLPSPNGLLFLKLKTLTASIHLSKKTTLLLVVEQVQLWPFLTDLAHIGIIELQPSLETFTSIFLWSLYT